MDELTDTNIAAYMLGTVFKPIIQFKTHRYELLAAPHLAFFFLLFFPVTFLLVYLTSNNTLSFTQKNYRSLESFPG